jgi:hypothetical protein
LPDEERLTEDIIALTEEFGRYRHNSGSGLTVTSDFFVDGLRSGDFTTYGAELRLAFEF